MEFHFLSSAAKKVFGLGIITAHVGVAMHCSLIHPCLGDVSFMQKQLHSHSSFSATFLNSY